MNFKSPFNFVITIKVICKNKTGRTRSYNIKDDEQMPPSLSSIGFLQRPFFQ